MSLYFLMVDNSHGKGLGLVRYCYLVPAIMLEEELTNNCNRRLNNISTFLIEPMKTTRTFALIVLLILSLVFFPSTFGARTRSEVNLGLCPFFASLS
jgi:hypothetical protein